MQVELIGCTGAGKTTLAQQIVAAASRSRIDLRLGDELALHRLGLDGLGPGPLRALLYDLGIVAASLLAWPTHQRVYRLTAGEMRRLPLTVPVGQKLNLTRNVLKKSGLHELIRRAGRNRTLILVDEGTLHAAHNLFVHVAIEPDLDQVLSFARIVRVPDAAVYLAPEPGLLIERTLARGHTRIPSRSEADVARFVQRALQTFDHLTGALQDLGRMVAIQQHPLVLIRPDRCADPLTSILLALLRDAASRSPANRAPGPAQRELGGKR